MSKNRVKSNAAAEPMIIRCVTAKIFIDPRGNMACDDITWDERICSIIEALDFDYSKRPSLNVQIQELIDQARLPKGGGK